jgi:hypothetical protein
MFKKINEAYDQINKSEKVFEEEEEFTDILRNSDWKGFKFEEEIPKEFQKPKKSQKIVPEQVGLM